MAQQRIAIAAILDGQRDADAGPDPDVAATDTKRLTHALDDTPGDPAKLVEIGASATQDSEFVAAEARDDIAAPDRLLQSHADGFQQGIAQFVTERVIDGLEPIEVQIEHRETARLAAMLIERALQMFAKLGAVGQVRQRIMMRHIGNAFLRSPAFGHVLIGRNPATVGHRLLRHGADSAGGKLERECRRAWSGRDCLLMGEHSSEALVSHSRQARSGLGARRRQFEHLAIALVADDQAMLAVNQQQSLRHVVQGRIEALVLCPQLDVAQHQHLVLSLQAVVLAGNVLIGLLEFALRLLESIRERMHLAMGMIEQAVAKMKQQNQAKRHQYERHDDAGEEPVQTQQFALIAVDLIAGRAIGRGREARHLLVERGQPSADPGSILRGEILDPWLDIGQGVAEFFDGRAPIGTLIDEILEVAGAEQAEAVEQDLIAQRHLVGIDLAGGYAEAGDPFLEALKFDDGLACEPGYIVARGLPDEVLLFDDKT
nr:hypothetical protein [Bosea sp. LC85]